MMAIQSTSSSLAPSSVMSTQPSPRHSPLPYLIGGLAAMLGLVAFALLLLACSYWKLSGYLHNRERDIESGESDHASKPNNSNEKPPLIFEEKYLVFMAGESTPTFLATQVSSRDSTSFRSCSWLSKSTVEMENDIQGRSDQLEVRIMDNYETADQLR